MKGRGEEAPGASAGRRVSGFLAGMGLVGLALVLGLTLGRRDFPRVEVLVDGRRLEARADIQHDRVYVAAHPLARELGLRVSYDPRDPRRGFLIQGEREFLLLALSPFLCHVRRKDAESGFPVFYLDSRTSTPMAPAELVARTFGFRVERDSDPPRLSILKWDGRVPSRKAPGLGE